MNMQRKLVRPLPFSVVHINTIKVEDTFVFTSHPPAHISLQPTECYCIFCSLDTGGLFNSVLEALPIPLSEIEELRGNSDTTPEDNAIFLSAQKQLSEPACA